MWKDIFSVLSKDFRILAQLPAFSNDTHDILVMGASGNYGVVAEEPPRIFATGASPSDGGRMAPLAYVINHCTDYLIIRFSAVLVILHIANI